MTEKGIKKFILLFFGLILLSSLLTCCSAKWHVKQAIKKDPSVLKFESRRDTVTFESVTAGAILSSLDLFKRDVINVHAIREVVVERDTIVQRIPIKIRQIDSVTVEVTPDCPEDRIVTVTNTETIVEPVAIWKQIIFVVLIFWFLFSLILIRKR